MERKWLKAKNFPGVRYRESANHWRGVQRDKYFTIRYKLNGKDKEEGLGWASEGWTAVKAYDRLKELKENRKNGEGPQTLAEKRKLEATRKEIIEAEQAQSEKDAVTFGNFFTKTYLPQVTADRPKSVRADEGLYNKWLSDAIGTLPFPQISPFHIEKIKKKMTDAGRSPRTIEYCLAIVRQVFNHARRLEVFAGECPTSKVKRPKIDNARMRYLTPEEADLLLRALAEKSVDVHDMALLSLHCGLRFGEIAALQWQDVDLVKSVLTIRDAKAGSRTTFLTEQTKSMFAARSAGKPSEYVFPARKSQENRNKGKRPNVSKTFFRVVEKMGLNKGITDRKLKVNFHTLRHSHGTLLYEATHDLYLVQKSLGHKTGAMAQRYAKMTETRLRDAAKILNQALQVKKTAVQKPDEEIAVAK